MHPQISAVIPSAGNSSRMGSDKALLPAGNGLTFAGHLVNSFVKYGCSPVVLVVNARVEPKLSPAENTITVVNHSVEKGRSFSIQLGLRQVPYGKACFIQNIDNLFIESELLDKLVGSAISEGYAVPVYHGRAGHPLLMGDRMADYFRNLTGEFDFRQELQRFPRVEVPFSDKRIRSNINSPDDYREFLQWNGNSRKML
jgi:CTP:molybdopterin cytidylyltransferase MocA